MDFGYDARTEELRAELTDFMQAHVFPAEHEFERALPRASVLLGTTRDHAASSRPRPVAVAYGTCFFRTVRTAPD